MPVRAWTSGLDSSPTEAINATDCPDQVASDTSNPECHNILRDYVIELQKYAHPWRYLTLANRPTAAAAAQALWNLDGSGTALDDLSNSHDWSVGAGVATYGLFDRALSAKALVFNGASYLSIASPGALQHTGAITIELVCSHALLKSSSDQCLIACTLNADETAAGNTLYGLWLRSDGRYEYRHEYGTGSDETHAMSISPVVGDRRHITVTRNAGGTSVKLYIDGVLMATVTPSNAPATGTSTVLYLGGTPAGDYLHGAIASARITLEEWSGSQVAEAVAIAARQEGAP